MPPRSSLAFSFGISKQITISECTYDSYDATLTHPAPHRRTVVVRRIDSMKCSPVAKLKRRTSSSMHRCLPIQVGGLAVGSALLYLRADMLALRCMNRH